jgi:hypothetical protein
MGNQSAGSEAKLPLFFYPIPDTSIHCASHSRRPAFAFATRASRLIAGFTRVLANTHVTACVSKPDSGGHRRTPHLG